MSDLHSEFMKNPKRFVDKLPVAGDVLVVAGDSGSASTTVGFLKLLEQKFEKVLFVAGNHEYYGSDGPSVDEELSKHPGFLKRRVVNLDGVKVAGATLWFREWEVWKELLVNDFRMIGNFREWVVEENAKDEAFLKEVAGEVDLVVTHHIPTKIGVAKQFKNSPLNDFFLCPLADELEELPRAWVFGHTHIGKQFEERGCQFVCNPRGYGGEGRFVKDLVIEL